MKQKLFGFLRTNNRRGLALISVLALVTLATILIMALFSVSDSEYRASTLYAEGNAARHLADSAINIVTAQIQTAATGATAGNTPASPTIWASQPGAVRVYNSAGQFVEGRTLFSSSEMVTRQLGQAGEIAFTDGGGANARSDPAWDQKPDQWTDLNAPAIKVEQRGSGSFKSVVFPVMDPRALENVPETGTRIEGFDIFKSPSGELVRNPSAVSGVVTSGVSEDYRCPMPVEWLYVLKDGSVGTVDAPPGGQGGSQWRAVSGSTASPSAENPIVGRIAFWTDDEATKININTAGEPSPWMVPLAFHKRDMGFANYQPLLVEYQRYPGHPATVSLSTVLHPGLQWDTYPTYPKEIVDYKQRLYEFLPRLGSGGTVDGTEAFEADDFKSDVAKALNWNQIQRERFFLSVDEMIFASQYAGNTRKEARLPGVGGANVITPQNLTRAKFFLTATSSSPETNMFSYPRVAIWPLPDKSLGQPYRTGYDYAVEAASTLGPYSSTTVGNLYAFSRIDSHSATLDLGAGGGGNTSDGTKRNRDLLNYLDGLMAMAMPGGNSFRKKYEGGGQGFSDSRQILVSIFDYIRCTNLFDSFLNERTIDSFGLDYRDGSGGSKGADDLAVYLNTPKFGKFYTYTEPRFQVTRRAGDVYGLPTNQHGNFQPEEVTTGAYPGHGQVRPIEWTPQDGRQTYKGFGRFPTISEIALHFICTADGLPSTNFSYGITKNGQRILSGGKVAQMIDITKLNQRVPKLKGNPQTWDRWYSNLPPFPNKALFEKWGCDFNAISNPNAQNNPTRHPAWDSKNWNLTLDFNPALRTGVELLPTEKRVQVAIQVETFIPAAGWTKYVPDWTMVLDADTLSNLKIKAKQPNGGFDYVPIFETTGKLVVQSTSAYVGGSFRGMSEGNNVYPMGGAYGSGAFMNGRRVKAVGRMPNDPGYNDQANAGVHNAMQNFPFVSSFFTVPRDTIEFSNGGSSENPTPMKLSIYASHDWEGVNDKRGVVPVQTFEIGIPGGKVPSPSLVVHSTEKREYDDGGNHFLQLAVPAVRWWTFNYGGAVNRYKGVGNQTDTGNLWSGVVLNPEGNSSDEGDESIAGQRTWGRFHGESRTAMASRRSEGGESAGGGPPVALGGGLAPLQRQENVIVGGTIYGFSSSGSYSGTRSWYGRDQQSEENNELTGGFQPAGNNRMGVYNWWGSDSIRSIIPKHGDYRLVAAKKVVTNDMWMKHPVWTENPNALFAHSLTSYSSDSQVGFHAGEFIDPNIPKADNRLLKGIWYPLGQVPDIPMDKAGKVAASVARTGDFDNGIGLLRDGAYINKPDDGNLSVMKFWINNSILRVRNAYFTQSWMQMPTRGGFFTPNRLIPSPGVFGSLPTGVFGSKPNDAEEGKSTGVPWRTLLFRPGFGTHVGASEVADHNIMDLFWMPVVDPRPMSYAFATEGKVNINYQILPFRHIRRATGMHAVLKGELVTTLPSDAVSQGAGVSSGQPNNVNTLLYKKQPPGSYKADLGWSEAAPDSMYFHRPINVETTLKQWDERFRIPNTSDTKFRGLFRTASEICEMHLVPTNGTRDQVKLSALDAKSIPNAMRSFWTSQYKLTGDNARERPYMNIYQKITTRSNTFRVYMKAQTIKKASSLSPTEVDTTKDTITAEYQGSALLERYLDLNPSVEYVDYARGASSSGMTRESLESKYRYRVVEMKQFLP